MLQMNAQGCVALPEPEESAALAARFAEAASVRLPGLLEPEFRTRLSGLLDDAVWADREHGGIGRDRCLMGGPALSALHFAFNDPAFLRLVEAITGRTPLVSFVGHVFRLEPGSGHFDTWHTDDVQDRWIGLTLNLSPAPYEGGRFQLRDVTTGALRCDIANVGPGDAVLFSIGPTLEHRATPVTGTRVRTTCAGWFHPTPLFLQALRAGTVEP